MHGQVHDKSQHSQQKHIHDAGGIGTQNHIKRMAAERRATGIRNFVCYKSQLNIYANYTLSYITCYIQLSSVERCSDVLQTQL